MSQSGYTPIQLYRTTTASATPSAGNLSAGELAINLTDEKLFFKNASGTVKVLASTGAGNAGGSNTQVQYNNAGVLAGSSSFVFDGTNVGIGTSSPTSGAGYTSVSLRNSTGGNVDLGVSSTIYGQWIANSTSSRLLASNGAYQTFEVGGSERMRIDTSGNVGIGTPNPTTRLEVYGGLLAGSENRQTHPNANAGGGFKAQWNYTGGSGETDLYNAYSTATLSFRFYQTTGNGTAQLLYDMAPTYHIAYTGGSERMRIDSSGNVGIGTSSFTSRLTVQQDQAAYSYFDFYNVTNGGGVVWRQVVRNIANTGTTSIDIGKLIGGGFVINNNDTDSSNFTAFSVGASERFRITSTGGITSSNVADAVGYKGLPQNAQTSSYTLALSDMGKHISITTGGVVIPANASVAFPIGSAIAIYNNSGSNQTISITSDTLRQAGTANTGSRTLAQYGLCTVTKVASTTWVISGAGVS